MPRALNLLRQGLHYRREAFDHGLRAAGFSLPDVFHNPRAGDLLLIWNRYGGYDEQAKVFERAGGTVLVTENGPLGKTWRGGEWFSLARSHVAGAGAFPVGGWHRWESWGVELAPWRTGGTETVILGQRGIGEPGVRSPDRWAESARRRFGGRIRPHPGTQPAKALLDELADARQVLTFNSGAALQALLAGIPVWYEHPEWIGARAARALDDWPGEPVRDDEARLEMFRRLAWANWTLDEIRAGEPIRRLVEMEYVTG